MNKRRRSYGGSPRVAVRLRDRIYQQHRDELGYVPCYVCGKHVDWIDRSMEHIVPRSQDGPLTEENIAISHKECNNKRSNSRDERSKRV